MAFQIIHTFEKFIKRFDYSGDFEVVLEKCLLKLLKMNIDGIVININTENGYLENEENWTNLAIGMRVAAKLGFRMWLYDEKGYPSGGAGGLVLRDNPELEAKGIKFFEGNYFISNIYEGSHAERNFHEKRRYINLLESEAVKKFADSTYIKYKEKLPAALFDQVEAFFTDEPSLMTVVTEVLDGSDSNSELASVYPGRVMPVNDEPDSTVSITPSIPYSRELDEIYASQYGKGLLDAATNVFEYSDIPSEEKCRFWEAVAITYEKTYGKILSGVCERMGMKLTGHLLFEETPILNTAFHSNPMRVLKHFQLPGIDLLSNLQDKISVFAHKMVASCAWQNDIVGIMTETSDFYEYRLGPKRPTEYKKIIAALYRQFALGVREFSFYYDFGIRKDRYGDIAGTIKNLCDFNEDLIFKPDCAIYCSYETVWSGFYPSMAKPFELYDVQPEFVKRFEDSILKLCDDFYKNNTQFVIMEESSIEKMIEKGIKQVVIPNCSVVNRKLIEFTDKGLIKIFGYNPEYTYADGALEKVSEVNIQPIKEIKKTAVPFEYEGNMICTIFEQGIYFCFNPGTVSVEILMNINCQIYNPVTDEYNKFMAGDSYSLGKGTAVIIK